MISDRSTVHLHRDGWCTQGVVAPTSGERRDGEHQPFRRLDRRYRRSRLLAYRGVFDGFHATTASISKTCLVRFDRNKYSVASKAVGRPVHYALDNEGVPTAQVGPSALVNEPPGVAAWKGPYLRRIEGLTDPWGRPYQYKFPGRNGQAEVFSLGRDNAPGGSGDDQDVSN